MATPNAPTEPPVPRTTSANSTMSRQSATTGRRISIINVKNGKSRHDNSLKINIDDMVETPRSSAWRMAHKLRLLKPFDYVYSADLTALWRRHLVWSHDNANSKELLEVVTGRFATTQIFLSLLFAAAVGTYFSPSRIVTDVRQALRTGPFISEDEFGGLEYACGIVLIFNIGLTGCAVLANYTALGVFKCIHIDNAAMILRSDVGLYAAQLPSRLTFFSILTFFLWNILFWWINNEGYYTPSLCLTIFTVALLVHVISTFSAMSHIIMETGAMAGTPILPKGTEEQLLPHQLTNVLLSEAHMARKLATPVNKKYLAMHGTDAEASVAASVTRWTYESSLKRRHPEIQLEDVQEMIAE